MLINDALSASTLGPAGQPARSSALSGNSSLASAFAALDVEADCEWALANYKRTVTEFCKTFAAQRLIEIGGGRDPLFDLQEIERLGVQMTINDISAGELAVLPPGYHTARFDVAGDASHLAEFRNSFDLAFSRMVFEHVADGQRAWTNLYELLAPGGVALAYIPTLYSLPFVVNWLLPDKLAANIVKSIYKHRTDEADPVFPARYSWCYADARMPKMLSSIGYREVFVQPFYAHGYYKPFPPIHRIHRWFSDIARRHDWRAIASFAYVAVRK
jgi:SAM-dependent methyltransferase